MRPRARGKEPSTRGGPRPCRRVFKGTLPLATAEDIAKGWKSCFPHAPDAETQLFLPPETMDETTEDQDTMLCAIAEMSPYAARSLIEAAIFQACKSPAIHWHHDQSTPISFTNQWTFQKWIMAQAKNAKSTLTKAMRMAKKDGIPAKHPKVIQVLASLLRGNTITANRWSDNQRPALLPTFPWDVRNVGQRGRLPLLIRQHPPKQPASSTKKGPGLGLDGDGVTFQRKKSLEVLSANFPREPGWDRIPIFALEKSSKQVQESPRMHQELQAQ